ncbi:hypothetical protein IJ670_08245, partial [bacterium]|nr:hypothetical protein [bacterium]
RKFSWEILPVEPIEMAPVESFLEMTGAKAAVIQEIAISEIKSSIREKARCFLSDLKLVKKEEFCVLRELFRLL